MPPGCPSWHTSHTGPFSIVSTPIAKILGSPLELNEDVVSPELQHQVVAGTQSEDFDPVTTNGGVSSERMSDVEDVEDAEHVKDVGEQQNPH